MLHLVARQLRTESALTLLACDSIYKLNAFRPAHTSAFTHVMRWRDGMRLNSQSSENSERRRDAGCKLNVSCTTFVWRKVYHQYHACRSQRCEKGRCGRILNFGCGDIRARKTSSWSVHRHICSLGDCINETERKEKKKKSAFLMGSFNL